MAEAVSILVSFYWFKTAKWAESNAQSEPMKMEFQEKSDLSNFLPA